MLEMFLNTGSRFFRRLEVCIKLIGSSIEGTRIWILDEADCFLLFKRLKAKHFRLVGASVTKYKVTAMGKAFLHPSFLDSESNLNYFGLFEQLLKEVKQFLETVDLPKGMSVKFENCSHKFDGDGNFDHLKHCKTCLPAVTFTKAGPCVILRDGDVVISIDLIPLLNCPELDPLNMFERVTTALIHQDLPDSLPYLKKFVKCDDILPEAINSQSKEGFTSLKLLHARSDEHMFILRPRQSLDMQNLNNPMLKRTYCLLKGLKCLMDVELSSYSIKKVLLLEDFTRQAGTATDSTHLLYLAISHPHLKPFFVGKVFEQESDNGKERVEMDFDKWSEWIKSYTNEKIGKSGYFSNNIPLMRK